MARVAINLPEQFFFQTQIPVLIQHVNRADHMGNEHLVAMLNEARMRYMQQLDTSKVDITPTQFINADLAVIYQSEAKHRDLLNIEVGASDFSKYGCDIVYRVTEANTSRKIAIAKTAMLYYDYQNSCLKPVPENFSDMFLG